MVLSRTITEPTNLRSQVEREETTRAMFMKYSSQETRSMRRTILRRAFLADSDRAHVDELQLVHQRPGGAEAVRGAAGRRRGPLRLQPLLQAELVQRHLPGALRYRLMSARLSAAPQGHRRSGR